MLCISDGEENAKGRYIILYGLLFLVSPCAVNAYANKCMHIDKVNDNDTDPRPCGERPICNQTFTIAQINLPPYNQIVNLQEHILKRCCGKCLSIKNETNFRFYHEMEEIYEPSLDNIADFIFPVLHRTDTVYSMGCHFIPVVRLPSLVYITPFPMTAFARAVWNVIQLYPLLIVCVLISIISGFFIWTIEKGCNEEYSISFYRGWLLGVWWSGVTLASTGFEQTPKSPIARLYSIVWLAIGVIMVGLLTSMITSAIIEKRPTPSMEGVLVGTRNFQPYDNFIISKNGGSIRIFEGKNVYEVVYQMAEALYKKEIDGIVLDKYTLSFVENEISALSDDDMKREVSLKQLSQDTVHTEFTDKDDMSYGICIKDKDVHDFFLEAIAEHWLIFNTKFTDYANKISRFEEKRKKTLKSYINASLFSPSDPFVFIAISVFGGMVVIIGIAGIFYEYFRKKKRKHDFATGKTNFGMQFEIDRIQATQYA